MNEQAKKDLYKSISSVYTFMIIVLPIVFIALWWFVTNVSTNQAVTAFAGAFTMIALACHPLVYIPLAVSIIMTIIGRFFNKKNNKIYYVLALSSLLIINGFLIFTFITSIPFLIAPILLLIYIINVFRKVLKAK